MDTEINEFREAFKGRFSGVLRWPQLERVLGEDTRKCGF